MRILFMGTPEFSVPCLEAIIDGGHTLVGVVTQPDKPKGRGHKLAPPPVKVSANAHGLEVMQPITLKDNMFLEDLERLKPDMIVVVAYGKILPKYVLEFSKYGCINVHASLLPKYRGAAPIQRCIIDGETETGITTMHMAEGIDTGDMILKATTKISKTETYGELHDKLSLMGAELLLKTIKEIEKGTAKREVQDDSLSNYAPMISKETGLIDWKKPARVILNQVRGTYPAPLSYTRYKGEDLKIITAESGEESVKENKEYGKIIGIKNKKLEVACGDGESILITELQFKGKKRMKVADYLNGHKIDLNEILG
ncbi:MAG: methionyl-tRNA formyltransferase [Oscillospiraceae bacterium]